MNQRAVVDGAWVFAAGVTAGIDGALTLAARLRGEAAAQTIQFDMVYAPAPPFDSGTPETAPPAVLEAARNRLQDLTSRQEATATRVAARLGINSRLPPGSSPPAHHDILANLDSPLLKVFHGKVRRTFDAPLHRRPTRPCRTSST